MAYHRPVLVSEVVAGLECAGGTYLDATLGGGGHSAALLEVVDGARIIAIDRDRAAICEAGARLAEYSERVVLLHGTFSQLSELVTPWLRCWGLSGLDGVLFDLGVSSHQIDEAARGFSYRQDGRLDMRMDRSAGVPVVELLAHIEETDLAHIIKRNSDERFARRLARTICRRRDQQGLRTTGELREAIAATRPQRLDKTLARVFQALRIEVNDELGQLEEGLAGAIELLNPGGRIATIAYHSLEDRLVKVKFAELMRGCICPPRVPVCTCGHRPQFRAIQRKPVRPSPAETEANPRARSAKLRLYEKL